MRSLWVVVVLSPLLAAIQACTLDEEPSFGDELADVYGVDDRKHPFEVRGKELIASRATAALISNDNLQRDDSEGKTWLLSEGTLGYSWSLCPEVPFASEPIISSCSGFFVGNESLFGEHQEAGIVVTAGHCVENGCEDLKVVFDYGAFDGASDSKYVPSTSVYSCTVVDKAWNGSCGFSDYAILRLDRKVEGRQALEYRRSASEQSSEVYAIGHPSGIPMKVTGSAPVREGVGSPYDPNLHLQAALDTFSGNSGGPWISAAADGSAVPVAEGITHCSPSADFALDEERQCNYLVEHPQSGTSWNQQPAAFSLVPIAGLIDQALAR